MKYILDITKEHCPMTFVKTKLQLEKLNSGDQLEVTLSDGEPLDNVPKTSIEQGYKVLETVKIAEHVYKLLIEK